MANCLKSISRKTITYDDVFPQRHQVFLSQSQVQYVEDIIVRRDRKNLWMLRKEVIRDVSDIGQEHYYVQVENNLD